jgi:nucleoid-associated protein YgaU
MLGFFKWLGALALLLVLLVGFPALLITAVGNPWPDGGASELALMSNSALMGILASVGWFVWAQLLLCTLWEIPPALRRETDGASRMPIAFGGQQRFMRMLVHTVLAIGVTSTTLLGSHAANAQAAAAPPLQPVTHVADQPAPGAEAPAVEAPVKANPNTDRAKAELPRIVTDKGDTMWGLAETHLGDGFRWQEIASLNKGRVMADGRVFNNPRNIEVGWELLLPADATNLPGKSPETEHTVAPTETLSWIALKTTGDADNWPALYEANKDVIGSDPNLILPGTPLVLPRAGGAADGATEDAPRERPAQRDDAAEAPDGGEQPTVPGATDSPADEESGGSRDDSAEPEAPATPVDPEQEAGVEEPPATSTQEPTQTVAADAAEADEDDGISALDALLASAVCLSAGALGLLLHNRRRQWRWRKTGRMIASTPDELVEVEASIIEYGTEAQKDAEFLDRALRYVSASCKVAGAPLPVLEGAVLGDEDLTLLFAQPAEAEVPEAGLRPITPSHGCCRAGRSSRKSWRTSRPRTRPWSASASMKVATPGTSTWRPWACAGSAVSRSRWPTLPGSWSPNSRSTSGPRDARCSWPTTSPPRRSVLTRPDSARCPVTTLSRGLRR